MTRPQGSYHRSRSKHGARRLIVAGNFLQTDALKT